MLNEIVGEIDGGSKKIPSQKQHNRLETMIRNSMVQMCEQMEGKMKKRYNSSGTSSRYVWNASNMVRQKQTAEQRAPKRKRSKLEEKRNMGKGKMVEEVDGNRADKKLSSCNTNEFVEVCFNEFIIILEEKREDRSS